MATLNFPDTTGQPTDGSLTYTQNNVIYSWNGTYWAANVTGSLDDRYVNIDGDTMTGKLTLDSTDAIKFPVGTTAQRPAGVAGDNRFNSSTNYPEYHNGSGWVSQAPDQIQTVDAAGWSDGGGNIVLDPRLMPQAYINDGVDHTFNVQPITLTAGTWLVTANLFAALGPNKPSAPATFNISLLQTKDKNTTGGANPEVNYCSKPDGIRYRALGNLVVETSLVFALTVNTSYTLNQVTGRWEAAEHGGSSGQHDLVVNCWYTAIKQT